MRKHEVAVMVAVNVEQLSQLSQNKESLVDGAADVTILLSQSAALCFLIFIHPAGSTCMAFSVLTCLTLNNTTTERVYLQTSESNYTKSSD